MEKISYNGRVGFFLPIEEQELLKETLSSFKEYREATKNMKEVEL